MADLELNSLISRLELQIDSLIGLLQQTRLENNSLHKKIASLNNENISILNKNKKAAELLKALIMQLQDNLLCQPQK